MNGWFGQTASALVIACAVGCGPSVSEVKTARDTTYRAPSAALFELAQHAAEEEYKIGEVDLAGSRFLTVPRMYTREGTLETPGAGGVILMRPGSVELAFMVELVPAGEGAFTVRITPKTDWGLTESYAPGDLRTPGFIGGRADALAVRIYDLGRAYAAPVAPRP